MPDALKLWTWQLSPFAGKVRVAFAEKGVEVELLEIHPAKRPPALKAVNPFFRVPVLMVGDTPIRESSAICEWIEETHPEPALWPADPTLRAWARGWAKWIDDNPTIDFFLGMRKQAFGKDPDDPEDVVERMHGRVPKAWSRLEDALGTHEGPWLAGEQFTLADVAGMAVAVRIPQWAAHLAPNEDEHPRVAAWFAALRERPSAPAIDAAGPERLSA